MRFSICKSSFRVHRFANLGFHSQICASLEGLTTGNKRRCQTGKEPCECQDRCQGWSAVVGCTLAHTGDGCRYNRSKRKIIHRISRAKDLSVEQEGQAKAVERSLEQIASRIGSRMQKACPWHHQAMTVNNHRAAACRLGDSPFGGVAVNRNYIAHLHKDERDLMQGLSAVLTALPPGAKEEQFHTIPNIAVVGSCTPEEEGVSLVLPSGSVFFEAARHYRHQTSRLNSPATSRVAAIFFQHNLLDMPYHGRPLKERGQERLLQLTRQIERAAMALDLTGVLEITDLLKQQASDMVMKDSDIIGSTESSACLFDFDDYEGKRHKSEGKSKKRGPAEKKRAFPVKGGGEKEGLATAGEEPVAAAEIREVKQPSRRGAKREEKEKTGGKSKSDDTQVTSSGKGAGEEPVATAGEEPVETAGEEPVETAGEEPVATAGEEPVETSEIPEDKEPSRRGAKKRHESEGKSRESGPTGKKRAYPEKEGGKEKEIHKTPKEVTSSGKEVATACHKRKRGAEERAKLAEKKSTQSGEGEDERCSQDTWCEAAAVAAASELESPQEREQQQDEMGLPDDVPKCVAGAGGDQVGANLEDQEEVVMEVPQMEPVALDIVEVVMENSDDQDQPEGQIQINESEGKGEDGDIPGPGEVSSRDGAGRNEVERVHRLFLAKKLSQAEIQEITEGEMLEDVLGLKRFTSSTICSEIRILITRSKQANLVALFSVADIS